jgi:hypothetical protein
MMKNYIVVILLMIGLLTTTSLSAQEFWGSKAHKKEYKIYKKESKIGRKMFRDRPRQAARKHRKAHKKYYKMHMKKDDYWW